MFCKGCNVRVSPGSSACPNCGSHSVSAPLAPDRDPATRLPLPLGAHLGRCPAIDPAHPHPRYRAPSLKRGVILSTFRRISRIVLTLLLVSAPVRAAEVVTVLADQGLGPFEAPVGFLHGVDDTLLPADRSLVADLAPKHWRLAGFETYQEVAQYDGVQITYTVSDPFGWAVGYPNVKPWEDPAGYESYVRWIVQSRSSWFPNHPVAFWDVWNEPDSSAFWTGTRDQLLEAFALTYNTIKDEDPDAQVVGPSFSTYGFQDPGLENIVDFLIDLDTQYGVRLDAISWHENGWTPWHILRNATAFRADLAAHFGPDYNPPLHINEYAARSAHLLPGWNVAYLFYLIEAGVGAAMRACWELCEDYGQPLFGYGNCWAGQNGLFTHQGDTPQAVYWVYKALGEMGGGERLTTQSLTKTNVIAGRDDSSESIRILIGRHDYGGASSDVSLRVEGYPFPHEDVRVEVRRIPASWETCDVGGTWVPKSNPLPAGPVYVSTSSASVVGGALNIDLMDFADTDAYVVVVSPFRPPIPAMSNRGLIALVVLLGSIGAVLARRTG